MARAARYYRKPFGLAIGLFFASAVAFYFEAPVYLDSLAQKCLARSRAQWLKDELRRQGKAFLCAAAPSVLLGIVAQAIVLGLTFAAPTDGKCQ